MKEDVLFKEKCISLLNDSDIKVKTKVKLNSFEEINYLNELNNCTERYSYKGITDALGYYNKYIIRYKKNIKFDELDIQSLERHDIPFKVIININTLRFMNYSLNTNDGIKYLIGYFFSNCNVLNQLYSYGITDQMLLYYFNINAFMKYNEDKEENSFISLTQEEYYSKFRRYITHEYIRWIKNYEKVEDETKNVVRKVLKHIKRSYILNVLYKNIYEKNNSIILIEPVQFNILSESDKIEFIKKILNNSEIKIPYYIHSYSIYELLRGEINEKYNCKTFSHNFVYEFFYEVGIVLQKGDNYDEIEMKIKVLIKQGKYLKGKIDPICEYLKISRNTLKKIVKLKGLEMPYQKEEVKEDYSNYFNKMYSDVPTQQIFINKANGIVRNEIIEDDTSSINEVDNSIFSKKKTKKVKWSELNKNFKFDEE